MQKVIQLDKKEKRLSNLSKNVHRNYEAVDLMIIDNMTNISGRQCDKI